MKQITLSTIQEDIDRNQHGSRNCPWALAFQRAAGCDVQATHDDAYVYPGYPAGTPFLSHDTAAAAIVPWTEAITVSIRRYDNDEGMEPMTVTFEVPDGVPVA